MNKFHSVRASLRRPSAVRSAVMSAGIAAVSLSLFATTASAQQAPSPPNAAAPMALAPTPDFTVTGSAGVCSQYRFRGISQSDNRPVIQGALTVTHSSGF